VLPGYFRVIPSGLPRNKIMALPTFNHTRGESGFHELFANFDFGSIVSGIIFSIA
jgi:hypothetical protein